jgi:hypothetical protein
MPYIPKDLQTDMKLVYTTRTYLSFVVFVPSPSPVPSPYPVPSKEWKIRFSQPIWRIEWKEGS